MNKRRRQTIQWTKEEGQTIQWTKEEGQTIQWTKEKDKQYNEQKKKTDNTTNNKKRQTIQWTKEGQTIQHAKENTRKTLPSQTKDWATRNSLKIEGDLYTIRKKVIWNNLTTQKNGKQHMGVINKAVSNTPHH